MSLPAVRSVSKPIVLTSIAVTLSIAMLVGWTLLIGRTFIRGPELVGGVWLLVSGVVSFVFVMAVLVMFGISLVREILESRRQVSFIDSVTHELKSPLSSLKLCLQTLGRPDLSEDNRAQLQTMMEADVERLSLFIDDVLHASRAGSCKIVTCVSDVDLGELVSDSVSNVEQRHKIEPGLITVQIDHEHPVLNTDRSALRVALDNLLDNAVKYSNSPINIRIIVREYDRKRIAIDVVDNGIGIDKRDLKKVFHRFYRAPDERTRVRTGTGLGLYVASAMVRGIGGRISAMSKGEDYGTRMRILLPISRSLSAQS